MRIKSIQIQNFRKLHSCQIDFSEKETIFVRANNSGKTTAMNALMKFLKTKYPPQEPMLPQELLGSSFAPNFYYEQTRKNVYPSWGLPSKWPYW